MEMFGGLLGIVVVILVVIMSVLWFILPFAVFGIKDRLDRLIAEIQDLKNSSATTQYEIKKTNQILKAVHNVSEE